MRIYHNENNIVIRSMIPSDVSTLYEGFLQQGWKKPLELFQSYYEQQEKEEKIIFIATFTEDIAGYTTLQPQAITGPYALCGIPEIVDLNVLIKYQKRGIAGKLLDIAEQQAKEISNSVTLAVGLHHGYGQAQKLYIKRGYIPDGSGVWYQDKNLEQYADCCNDDDLLLYLKKKLYSPA